MSNKQNRIFKLWEASPSFSKVLLRSPANAVLGFVNNIDLTFWGVDYLDIPCMLKGLTFDKPTVGEIDILTSKLGGELFEEQVFVLISGGQRYFVVAAGLLEDEHAHDIFEKKFDHL